MESSNIRRGGRVGKQFHLKCGEISADSASMSNKFVVSHMDQQMGPFDEQELKNRWAKGDILPIDYVYDENLKDWVLLAERFAWAKAQDVTPPPPVRTETGVRRMASLTNDDVASVTPAVTPAVTPTYVTSPLPQAVNAPSPAAPATVSSPIQITWPAAQTAAPAATPKPAPAPAPAPATAVTNVSTETVTINFTPAPSATTATAAPPPTAAPQARVQLVNGQAEIDLPSLAPGDVELVAADTQAGITLQQPHRIQVKPAEPVRVEWQITDAQTVGQDVKIELSAFDAHNNICLHYGETFYLHLRAGAGQREFALTMHDGRASLVLQHTVVETWSFALEYRGAKALQLPAPQSLEWRPGPAVRLVLDGPHEYIAGQPLKVQVKAVDQFGNVAKNFQGTVNLEVKAS